MKEESTTASGALGYMDVPDLECPRARVSFEEDRVNSLYIRTLDQFPKSSRTPSTCGARFREFGEVRSVGQAGLSFRTSLPGVTWSWVVWLVPRSERM